VHIPPLRARPEDINTLAYHFAVNVTKELRRPFFPGFTADAKAALLGYAWPGNVRELKNAVERSVYRTEAPDQPIAVILFDPFASPYNPAPPPSERVADEASAPPSAPASDAPVPSDFRAAVADFERQVLRRALVRAQFKQTVAAKLLGLSYHQFRSLLRKHGLAKQTADDGE
jgi:psp operon transcriptional activator